MKHRATRRSAGFSLIELIVVIAIILVVSAMAVPQVLTQLDTYSLRSTTSAVVGAMQSARMLAVKDNRYYTVRGINVAANLTGNTPGVFVDSVGTGAANGSGNNLYDNGEAAAAIPASVTFDTAGAHPPFNNALAGANFNPILLNVPPSFNSRGLPCVPLGANCVGGGGAAQYAFFLRQTGSSGVHWSAITVTASGRMRTWTWTGTTWAGN